MTTSLALTGRFTFTSPDGRWSWSDDMFTLHGLQNGEVVPTAALFYSHVQPEDRALVERAIQTCLVQSEPAGCEYRLIDLFGRERTVTLTVHHEPRGTVNGFVVDVTESRNRSVAERVNAELARALESRTLIDQAKGILMAIWGLDSQTSFECLSLISQHRNVRVRALADEFVVSASSAGGIGPAGEAEVRAAIQLLSERESRRPTTHDTPPSEPAAPAA